MANSIRTFVKKNRAYLLTSFLIPFLAMIIIYAIIGIYPGSSRSILASDAFSQSSNFYASFNNVLHGRQSIFYTWNASLGLNYLSLVSYYLGGFFTALVFFFPNQLMPDALYFITILKIGLAGLSFWFFAKKTFRIPRWSHVALSTAYALMSFVTAHSELIMWSDTFIYLPLIILGIHRVMDEKKPKLLFVSYLAMFLSSFYMGFIVGVFSVLYYFARLLTSWKRYKKSLPQYFLTSFLAGGASMIMILPAILDLQANGESLTQITQLKTSGTGMWDIFVKNMIGVYDTTKYGSIPFIYIGLFPFVLCLFYFALKSIPLKNKLLYGSVIGVLIASFYLVPLNLFWHGMHAPNMFLFRYAFLFSFMVILLAGYAWERITTRSAYLLITCTMIATVAFCIAYGIARVAYDFVTIASFAATIAFLLLYMGAVSLYQVKRIPTKKLSILLLILMTCEALLNTNAMINGILDDWNYASRSLYTDPYPDIQTLVDKTKKANDTFYRLENLDPVSSNDSINYGYSGVSLFSSIRNRNSSSYLDELGFRSRGTNLNIRYANNTLLMDSLLGIKYNISEPPINKFGFKQIDTSNRYKIYENEYALPLAFSAPNSIYDLESYANDNLSTQTDLINTLAGMNLNYFTFYEPEVTGTENVNVEENETSVTYKEEEKELTKTIKWKVDVPANTQAYLSLYPIDFNQLSSSSVTVMVNGESRKTQININGQYYDLGYYPEATTVEFSAGFYGTSAISFMEPKVLGMDTVAYKSAIDAIAEKGVKMKTSGRTATGTVNNSKEEVLLTTIPYDKGWKAYIDGKEVKIQAFEDAFVSITVPKGKHKITFKFLPNGFAVGAVLFVACILIFLLYLSWLKKQARKKRRKRNRIEALRRREIYKNR